MEFFDFKVTQGFIRGNKSKRETAHKKETSALGIPCI